MSNAITTRHAHLARSIRQLRTTNIVGEVLVGILACTFALTMWLAPNLHIATGMGCLSVFTVLCGFALHDMHARDIDRYRQRCSRMMVGFEQGYNDALACTRLRRQTDLDYTLGYDDGYVAGVDERNLRIKAIVNKQCDKVFGKRFDDATNHAYLKDLI